jgi:PD-(D/E)XK nuclease superfamily
MPADLKHRDITEKIIGVSFEAHKSPGNAFQEVIYQRALPYDLTQEGLSYASEIERIYFIKNSQNQLEKKSRFCRGGKKF